MDKTVFSWIVRVTGSPGHHLGSKDLQNKQGTGDGVPVDSPMPKLDREIESVKCPFFNSIFFHSFLMRFLPYL